MFGPDHQWDTGDMPGGTEDQLPLVLPVPDDNGVYTFDDRSRIYPVRKPHPFAGKWIATWTPSPNPVTLKGDDGEGEHTWYFDSPLDAAVALHRGGQGR